MPPDMFLVLKGTMLTADHKNMKLATLSAQTHSERNGHYSLKGHLKVTGSYFNMQKKNNNNNNKVAIE